MLLAGDLAGRPRINISGGPRPAAHLRRCQTPTGSPRAMAQTSLVEERQEGSQSPAMTSPRETPETKAQFRRRVRAAGYQYQDIVAALILARAIVDGYREVRIEAAQDTDAFDDHAVVFGDGRHRLTQVKHTDVGLALSQGDLANRSGRLAIDQLLTSARRNDSQELRVFANWPAPDVESRSGLLLPASAERIDPGLATSLWRLDADAIWPRDGTPRWPLLEAFTHHEFAAFCGRFVLELDGPAMSMSLTSPGPLEVRLLDVLRGDVGVTRPPNRVDPTDVASLLLSVATTARSRRVRTFSVSEILRETSLVVDDGRLAAAFPLESDRFVRTELIDRLLAEARTDGTVVVAGLPGAGKSWALESLVSLLREGGGIVARHYCFLGPGDPDAHARVDVAAMCANLIAELRSDPRLRDVQVGLARDPQAVEEFLKKALEQLRADSSPSSATRIVMIVDGIDHVGRADAVTGSRDMDEFVLALAGIELPPGVTLIVGSQRGRFLDALMPRAREVEPARFDEAQVAEQLARIGLMRALDERGLVDERERGKLISLFTERSAGNPLFVRYLALDAMSALAAGTSFPEILMLPETPAGELSAYYLSLLSGEKFAPVIAELLAVLEFAVNADDLSEMAPELGHARIEEAIRELRPVLDSVPGGGLQIYHESLRRFVIERARSAGTFDALVGRAVAWLETRGFFADDRAFRWLLRALRRAGRPNDCLRYIGADFVERSVAELHPGVAVAANIRTAAYAARDLRDFPMLAAIAELRTAATTAYEERVEQAEDYARTVIALRGAATLGRRLLYDGRPVRPRPIGLRMCALVDDAGGQAPWKEYLDLLPQEDRPISREEQQEQLDEAHGILRLNDAESAARSIADWARDATEIPDWYARGLAALLRKTHGSDALRAVLSTANMPANAVVPLYVELAISLQQEATDLAAAVEAGRAAVKAGAHEAQLVTLLECGVPTADLVGVIRQPEEIVPTLLGSGTPDRAGVAEFISAVAVHAASGKPLGPLRALLAGEGWYRRWLRYVVDLGAVQQGGLSIVEAFEEVARDTQPFVGQPRAIDLYTIAREIQLTLRRGFLLATPAERRTIAPRLLEVAVGSTGRIHNTPIGAFPLAGMLDLLEDAPDPEVVALAAKAVKQSGHEEYGSHADDALRMARLWNAVGESGMAEQEWSRACRLLAAYGYHKDITIFSLLEGIEAIAKVDPLLARERALRVRRLTELVVVHTDGDETRHAPNSWLRTLLKVDAALATRTLARTVVRNARVPNTTTDDLMAAALAAVPVSVPALVRHVLWRCIPARTHGDERLAVVAELMQSDRQRGERAFVEVAADIEGDAEDEEAGTDLLRRWLAEHALPDCGIGLTPTDTARPRKQPNEPLPERPAPREDGPFLPTDLTPAGLVLALRRMNLDRWNEPISQPAFARELSSRLRRVAETSGEETVLIVLQDFARSRPFLNGRAVFEGVSDALRDDYPGLAAEGYVLAWCSSRRDWQVFGDEKDADLLDRAVAIDEGRALGRFTEESADAIDRYEFSLGVSQRIVEVLAHFGRAYEAAAAWDAAFEVVRHRLPDLGSRGNRFALPDDQQSVDWMRTYGELLGALLTHPDFARRAVALSAAFELAQVWADLARIALATAAGSAVYSDQLIALEAARAIGTAPSSPDRLRELVLTAPFTVAALAKDALEAAGETSPAHRPHIWITLKATAAEIKDVLPLDYDQRVERIGRLWDEFPEVVADAYRRRREADHGSEEIRRAQAEAQRSFVARWVPALPLHDWDREHLEGALGEALGALRAHLLAQGQWDRFEETVLRLVTPDVRTSQARARSRIPRPVGPLPEDAVEGHSDAGPEATGVFAGWIRVAHVELSARAVDERRERGVQSVVRSGLVVRGAGANEPLVYASWPIRWHDEAQDDDDTHIALAARQEDCTAWNHVLSPTMRVRRLLGLAPASLGALLDLVEPDGTPAISLRYWRMRPYDYEYGPATPLVHGTALFMRTSAWARVRAEFGDFERLTVRLTFDLP